MCNDYLCASAYTNYRWPFLYVATASQISDSILNSKTDSDLRGLGGEGLSFISFKWLFVHGCVF